jgi:hypothetical protein
MQAELNELAGKEVQAIINGSKPEIDLIAEFMQRMNTPPRKVVADEP